MKIRKSLTAVGAALLMVGISAPVSAQSMFVCGTDPVTNPYDKDVIAAGLKDIAERLRCEQDADDKNDGLWPDDLPLWQKGKKGGGNGCDIHDSLARKLLEFRDFNGGKPPKNENNLAAGASWDLTNEKYEAAFIKLESFISDAEKATPNELNSDAEYVIDNVLLRDIRIAKECVGRLFM
jgi:hypothetical protein